MRGCHEDYAALARIFVEFFLRREIRTQKAVIKKFQYNATFIMAFYKNKELWINYQNVKNKILHTLLHKMYV